MWCGNVAGTTAFFRNLSADFHACPLIPDAPLPAAKGCLVGLTAVPSPTPVVALFPRLLDDPPGVQIAPPHCGLRLTDSGPPSRSFQFVVSSRF